jgi:L-ribulose-5-phosphate 3-epimerase UlaE
MKNMLGVIQGRLLPKYKGRYQAHPKGYWADEFEIAKSLGLDCIEFILDYNDANQNPLLNKNELNKLQLIIFETGVAVQTICADYFMEAPLHSGNKLVSDNSMKVLKRLLKSAEILGVSDIVIPCVDQSSLNDSEAVKRFVKQINCIVPDFEEKGINLSLETDLAPQPFVELLSKFNSERITVNYDIGNSASLGFNPIEELDAYGDRITDIHIKDRSLNGGPVLLGKGNANFELFFNKLKEFNYKGPFIMQAYRDDEGLQIFKKQQNWIQKYLDQV